MGVWVGKPKSKQLCSDLVILDIVVHSIPR